MKRFITKILISTLALWILCPSVNAATQLTPGGQVIGLALQDDTLTVASIDATVGRSAQQAGIQVGDRLVKVNGCAVESIQQVRSALEHSQSAATVEILRNGKTKTLQLTPEQTQDGPRLGLYLKEGVTGIGTVTYYDPETGAFGALGHGVNTPTGDLVAMEEGTVFPAKVLSVKKGAVGKPGLLMGALEDPQPVGALVKNTPQGVFGTITANANTPAVSVATREQVHTGDAVIRSTIDDNSVQEYSVEILKIYPGSNPSGRNMLLKVTDQRLLDTTGGIVQGMSGSPIIQDGKLVGAVTHVLVNDPTTGYGIFIENMLDAAA